MPLDLEKVNKVIAFKEGCFKSVLVAVSIGIVAVLSAIFLTLAIKSTPSLKEISVTFFWQTTWDPVAGQYGALPFLVGTLYTSFMAILISTPFSIAIALTLGEYLKQDFLSAIIRSLIELLAGIPSVIYGLWAIFFLVPLMQKMEMKLGIIPDGVGILTAAIVLAIMIIPYSASIAREVISMVPRDLKMAAYALGSTRFEVIKHIVLPYSRSGVFAGIVLALGRALGETMAVTMVIGNRNGMPKDIIINQDGLLGSMQAWSQGLFSFIGQLAPAIASLFSSSNTMASIIANEFSEATLDLYISSLIEIALLLFVLSTLINLFGKEIIHRINRA